MTDGFDETRPPGPVMTGFDPPDHRLATKSNPKIRLLKHVSGVPVPVFFFVVLLAVTAAVSPPEPLAASLSRASGSLPSTRCQH